MRILAAADVDRGFELILVIRVAQLDDVPVDGQGSHDRREDTLLLLRADRDRAHATLGTAICIAVEHCPAFRLRHDDPEVLHAFGLVISFHNQGHRFLHFALFELEHLIVLLIIGVGQGGAVLCGHFALDDAGRAALSDDLHRDGLLFILCRNFDLLLGKRENSRAVRVDNLDGCLLALSELEVRALRNVPLDRQQLHFEVLLLLVAAGVHNDHLDLLPQHPGAEGQGAARFQIVVFRLRRPCHRAPVHLGLLLQVAAGLNTDSDLSGCLQDCVIRRAELDLGLIVRDGFHRFTLGKQLHGQFCSPLLPCLGLPRRNHTLAREHLPRCLDPQLCASSPGLVLILDETTDVVASKRLCLAVLRLDVPLHQRHLVRRGCWVHDGLYLNFLGAGQHAGVGHVCQHKQHPEEDEGQRALPPFYDVRTDPNQDDQQPDVGENGKHCGASKHAHVLDLPEFAARNSDDADGHNAEQIKRRAADDRARAQVARDEGRENADHIEKDLRRARAESHEGQVRDRRIPHADGALLLRLLVRDQDFF
mmetsp:Transcript_54157/g.156436  ORF Transcript_54157/g.156436 Transcript_54157/m.156436 type:complete len:536 (+) Transcript_54157:755-2362(+)